MGYRDIKTEQRENNSNKCTDLEARYIYMMALTFSPTPPTEPTPPVGPCAPCGQITMQTYGDYLKSVPIRRHIDVSEVLPKSNLTTK